MNRARLDGLLGDPASAGVYDLPAGCARLVRAAAAARRLPYRRVALASAEDKRALLRVLARALRFPATFGHNWDAFADAVGDLRARFPDGLVLLLDGTPRAPATTPGEVDTALAILREAAAEWGGRGTPLWVLVSAR